MEKLKEYITDELKHDFKRVIVASQNVSYDNLNVDNIFNKWAENKEKIFHLLGDQLIKNCGKIKINLPDKMRENKLNNFLDYLYSNTYSLYKSKLLTLCDPLISDVYNNKIKIDIPLDDGRIIPKGMKLNRAFGYFVQDKDLLTHIQDQYSIFLQDLKVEGELCISIHPLDFLSLSENNSNWRSCHSLDGDYRAGNLAYMSDNCTFIAYIKTKYDTHISRFGSVEWNNKIWRCLFFLNEDNTALFAGRQYPRNLELEPLNEILNILNIENLKEWKKCSNIPGILDKVWSKNKLFYNDLLNSSYYTDPYVATTCSTKYEMEDFTIGEDVGCLYCGQTIESGSSFFCEDHIGLENRVRCSYCGNYHDENEVEYVEGFGYVCKGCLEDNFVICEDCGKIIHNDDAYYDEETEMYYCEDCYNG